MTKKYFNQILETYYKLSFQDPTGSQGKNFVKNVNECIITNLNLNTSEVIVLPSGCYSKMVDKKTDLKIYQTCLSQFGVLPENTLELIRQCCISTPISDCTSNADFVTSKNGDVQYYDCCGNIKVISVDVGNQTIKECITTDSILPYDKNGTPATIVSVTYNGELCNCAQ